MIKFLNNVFWMYKFQSPTSNIADAAAENIHRLLCLLGD